MSPQTGLPITASPEDGGSTNCITSVTLNTLRPRQNGSHFPDDIFKCIFLNKNELISIKIPLKFAPRGPINNIPALISIKIPLKFAPRGPINNIPALVQIMAWRRPGDKPLSEPMMVNILTHICVTQPQWVKKRKTYIIKFYHLWIQRAQVVEIVPREKIGDPLFCIFDIMVIDELGLQGIDTDIPEYSGFSTRHVKETLLDSRLVIVSLLISSTATASQKSAFIYDQWGPLLLAEIGSTNIGIRAQISNCLRNIIWDVITRPCPKFDFS